MPVFGAVLSMMSLGCVMAAAPRSIQHCVSELFGGSFLSLRLSTLEIQEPGYDKARRRKMQAAFRCRA